MRCLFDHALLMSISLWYLNCFTYRNREWNLWVCLHEMKKNKSVYIYSQKTHLKSCWLIWQGIPNLSQFISFWSSVVYLPARIRYRHHFLMKTDCLIHAKSYHVLFFKIFSHHDLIKWLALNSCERSQTILRRPIWVSIRFNKQSNTNSRNRNKCWPLTPGSPMENSPGNPGGPSLPGNPGSPGSPLLPLSPLKPGGPGGPGKPTPASPLSPCNEDTF